MPVGESRYEEFQCVGKDIHEDGEVVCLGIDAMLHSELRRFWMLRG